MNVYALFAGLVRNQALFKKNLQTLIEWQKEGIIHGIVYSTWHLEVDKYPGLRAYLKNCDITLIESPEPELLLDIQPDPPLPKPVTIIQQIKSLRLGIDFCPDNSWIVRIRPELHYINNDLKETIRSLDIMSLDSSVSQPLQGWPHIFSQKVVGTMALCLHPLFIGDISYIGQKEDLKKLATPSVIPQLFGLRMNCEQQLYANIFLQHFPIFGQFFQLDVGLQQSDYAMSEKIRKINLEDPFFLKVLATYYLVLDQYFEIGYLDRSFDILSKTKNELDQWTLEELFSSENARSLPRISYSENANAMGCSHLYWLRHLLHGGMANSSLKERFLNAVAEVKNYQCQHLYDSFLIRIADDAAVYADKILHISSSFSLRRNNIPRKNHNEIYIQGMPMNISLLQNK